MIKFGLGCYIDGCLVIYRCDDGDDASEITDMIRVIAKRNGYAHVVVNVAYAPAFNALNKLKHVTVEVVDDE